MATEVKTATSVELTTAVLRTADAFLRESQRLFRPFGLTASQYNVLNVLAGFPAGVSQRELGDLLVVDRSNVTGLVDRMARIGWVTREDDPTDRRVYRVRLTAAGRKLWDKTQPLYFSVATEVARSLSPRRVGETIKALRQLEKAAAAWKTPPKNKRDTQ